MASRPTDEENKQRSTLYSFDRGLRVGHAKKGFHRTRLFGTDCQIPSVFSSEEGFYGKKNDSRLVPSKPIHSVSRVQDDYSQGRPSGPRPRVLDSHFGLKRRLLARSDSGIIPKLSSVQGGVSSVSLQSDAFRSQHRTESLHQARKRLDKGVEDKRRQDLCLSRRLVGMGIIASQVQSSLRKGTGSREEIRFPGQREEVDVDSLTESQVARTCMEHEQRNLESSSRLSEQGESSSGRLRGKEICHEKTARESSRSSQLCMHGRSSWSSLPKEGEQTHEEGSECQAEGQAISAVCSTEAQPSKMVKVQCSVQTSSMDSSAATSGSLYGRIPIRMGLPHIERTEETRSLDQSVAYMPYQHQGDGGDMDSTSIVESQERNIDSSSFRQQHRGMLFEQRGFSQITTPLVLDPFNCTHVGNQRMVSNSGTCERDQQRSSGRTIQRLSDRDGMGVRYGELRVDSESRCETPGGFVRHQGEPQATSVCISYSRRWGNRDRRPQNRLELLEDDLPVPTGKDVTSGSPQTADFQGFDCSSSSLLAQSILVSKVAADVQIPSEISTSSTFAESSREEAHRQFILFLGPSRLDFLRRCLKEIHGLQVTGYLLKELRESSIRQYETAWTSLLRYVRLKKLCSFSETIILEFFVWLFENGPLQANTIASYKSALKKPLRLGFNIHLDSEHFLELSRAFFHIRPPPPMVEPQWSLNKVLNFLKTRRFTVNPSLEDLTLKALFLLALASGRRVGELHSLIRRRGFIVFGERYNWVRLHPNPQFLAKNETASFRRGPILINAFKTNPNTHHLLCPVNALRTFLSASKGLNLPTLFFNPRTHAPCTKARISQLIRRVVKLSQPGIYARAHDLRKFATVQAFFANMSLEEIRSAGFWSSNKTIAARYLPLNVGRSQPCVALGKPTTRSSRRR